MRSVEVTLGGATYQMPVNFAASVAIAEHCEDPMKLMLQAAASQRDGNVYLEWSTERVVEILYQGIVASGADVERAEIGEAVVEAGVFDMLTVAANYIGELVGGNPKYPLRQEKKARRPKSRKRKTG